MRRRTFIAGIGSAAAAWPVVARAQGERMRQIGVLSPNAVDNEYKIVRCGFTAQSFYTARVRCRLMHRSKHPLCLDVARSLATATAIGSPPISRGDHGCDGGSSSQV